MAITSSRPRQATLSPGKQPSRFFVFGAGLLAMIQDHRPPALAADIFTDRFRERAGYVLVRLFGECLELVPGGCLDP